MAEWRKSILMGLSSRLLWVASCDTPGNRVKPAACPILPPVPPLRYPGGQAAGEREMKAIVCREWGGPDTLLLAEAARPQLQPHEARIRVHACGVNFADTLMIAGKYQVRPEFPFTPGLEAAGEVIEIGAAVRHLTPGRRVLAVMRFGGAYAEEIVVNADAVVPIPDAMDFVTAAVFPVAYGTSHFALTHRGHLRRGETLLVLGAAGGVGLTAVEIGKELGARVIAAAGGPDKLAVAQAHGADELIDYRHESIRDRVRDLTGGLGADVVFDPVGGDAFDQALRAVNWEARMLVIGFAAGRIQAVPANLILVKNISVIGVVWGAQAARDPVLVSRNLAELLRWWEAGRLRPVVAKTFPLPEAGAAMQALLSRRYAGKIVLEV
jgi:NADPH:quinone reductase